MNYCYDYVEVTSNPIGISSPESNTKVDSTDWEESMDSDSRSVGTINDQHDISKIKEIIVSQQEEIESFRSLLKRKDEVISLMSNLLNITEKVDHINLNRIVSSSSDGDFDQHLRRGSLII